MSALSEALASAQRQAIAAVSKAYLSGHADEGAFRLALNAFGSTDIVEQDQLIYALDTLKAFGTSEPEYLSRSSASEPASPRQMKYVQDLADKFGTVLPSYPLTAAQASQVIEELKAGTYVSDTWEVPF